MQVRGQRENVHFYGRAGRAIKMKFLFIIFFSLTRRMQYLKTMKRSVEGSNVTF